MLAEIFGVDGIIVLLVVGLVLFGSSQVPKIARSLGSAQSEFKHGLRGISKGTAVATLEVPSGWRGPAGQGRDSSPRGREGSGAG